MERIRMTATASGAGLNARLRALAVVMVLAATEAFAQEQAQAVKQNETKREVIVSIPDRKLALIEDGEVIATYTVAVGKASTPSPTGDFTIVNRVTNPTYYHKGQVIPSGTLNPVGTRWIGLNQKGYGIHGTNEPRSIGKAASHGCIRMAKADLEELFELVRPGDTVSIRGERDEEITQIFDRNNETPDDKVVIATVNLAAEAPATSAHVSSAAGGQ